MNFKVYSLFLLLILPANAWALFELSFDFGYQKQVYGSTRENDITTRTYSGALAMYLFSTTALEVNFSNNEKVSTESTRRSISGFDLSLVSSQNTVEANVYGIGLKQSLAPRGSRLKPLISIGYAKQFIRDYSDYTYEVDSTGQRIFSKGDVFKSRTDSVFASFILQLAVSQRLSLKASVRTVFKAFEFSQARDDMKYLVGFSWYL
jgi:hypothetical protein